MNESAYFREELMSKNLRLNRPNLKKLGTFGVGVGTPSGVFWSTL